MTTTAKKTHAKTTSTELETATDTSVATGTSPDTPAPTQRQAADRQAIIGIQRNLGSAGSITLVGKDYTPANLIALFQGRVEAADTTDQSERTWHDDVASEREVEASVAPTRKAFRSYLVARYGATSKKLAEFGVTPPKKKRKPDAATLAAAAVKSEQTRTARGTLGRRQREKIKGAAATTPAGDEGATATPPATANASSGKSPANGSAT